MIDHVWTVLCSSSAIDIESNALSLHNILEKISVRGRPEPDRFLRLSYDLVSLWVRRDLDVPCTGHYRARVLDPDGQLLHTFEMNIDLADHERARNRMHIQGLPAPQAGRYTFVVELAGSDPGAWQEVARVPLSVAFEDEPAGDQ